MTAHSRHTPEEMDKRAEQAKELRQKILSALPVEQARIAIHAQMDLRGLTHLLIFRIKELEDDRA